MTDSLTAAGTPPPGTVPYLHGGKTYFVPVLDATGHISQSVLPVPTPPPPPKTAVGMFVDGDQVQGVQALGTKLGVTPTIAGSYTNATDWPTIAGWANSPFYGQPNTPGYRLTLGLNIPSGAHDTDVPGNLFYPTTLATGLVAKGFSNAVIRFLWEMNDAGANTKSITSRQAFLTAFNSTHDAMNGVAGADFEFEFCVNAGQGFIDGTSFAAGLPLWLPSTAKAVGNDYYLNPNYPTEANIVPNITWCSEFAAAHGLNSSLSEFGAGDDNHASFFTYALSAVYGHQGAPAYTRHVLWQSPPNDDVTTPNNAAAYAAGVLAG